MTTNNKTWRQHYIPQWYQSFWATNKYVNEYNTKYKTVKRRSIKSINYGEYFYSTEADDKIEKSLFKDLDDKMPEHIKKIKQQLEVRNVSLYQIIEAEDEGWLKLLALQFVRIIIPKVIKMSFSEKNDSFMGEQIFKFYDKLGTKMRSENWNMTPFYTKDDTFGYVEEPFIFCLKKAKDVENITGIVFPLSPKILIFYYEPNWFNKEFFKNTKEQIRSKIITVYRKHCNQCECIYYSLNHQIKYKGKKSLY